MKKPGTPPSGDCSANGSDGVSAEGEGRRVLGARSAGASPSPAGAPRRAFLLGEPRARDALRRAGSAWPLGELGLHLRAVAAAAAGASVLVVGAGAAAGGADASGAGAGDGRFSRRAGRSGLRFRGQRVRGHGQRGDCKTRGRSIRKSVRDEVIAGSVAEQVVEEHAARFGAFRRGRVVGGARGRAADGAAALGAPPPRSSRRRALAPASSRGRRRRSRGIWRSPGRAWRLR